tara:strand:- start:199 stop:606 length:408 start_codon:yes stop_codon:yes gene_type:complete
VAVVANTHERAWSDEMRQDLIPHWSLHELVLMGRWIEESWGEMRGYDLVVDGRYRLAGVVNFPTQSLLLRAIIESSWKILACVCPPEKRTVATRAVGVGLMNLLSHLPRELVNSTVASAAEVGLCHSRRAQRIIH